MGVKRSGPITMTPISPGALLAIGPVPRRWGQDVEGLLKLMHDADNGILLESGVYDRLAADSD